MHVDTILACILVAIGAMIAYALDEQLQLTPRLSAWLVRILGEN